MGDFEGINEEEKRDSYFRGNDGYIFAFCTILSISYLVVKYKLLGCFVVLQMVFV